MDCKRVREMIKDNVYEQSGKKVRMVVFQSTTLKGSDIYLLLDNAKKIFGIAEVFEDSYELRF